MEDKSERWYFTKEELYNTPSRTDGLDNEKELQYRQLTASFITEMGMKLNVSQLCISTAIVYMHRFYMLHSFRKYTKSTLAVASLFLACKVFDLPRKLEIIVPMVYSMLNQSKQVDVNSDEYRHLQEEVTTYEMVLLQTLGFEVQVDHPHPHVVRACQLIRASKDLAQTAYFMAHNSVLLTCMCLEYKPSVVACLAIHLACQWKGIEIPVSSSGKHWWEYTDSTVNLDTLNNMATEFLEIYEKAPPKLKKKLLNHLKGKDSSSKGVDLMSPSSDMKFAFEEGSSSHSSSSSSKASSSKTVSAGLSSSVKKHDSLKGKSTFRDPSKTQPSSVISSGASKSTTAKALPVLLPLTVSDGKPDHQLAPLPKKDSSTASSKSSLVDQSMKSYRSKDQALKDSHKSKRPASGQSLTKDKSQLKHLASLKPEATRHSSNHISSSKYNGGQKRSRPQDISHSISQAKKVKKEPFNLLPSYSSHVQEPIPANSYSPISPPIGTLPPPPPPPLPDTLPPEPPPPPS